MVIISGVPILEFSRYINFLEPCYIMSAKTNLRQYVIFIKRRKFDTADGKVFFTVNSEVNQHSITTTIKGGNQNQNHYFFS